MNENKPRLAILINSFSGGGAEKVVSLLLPRFRDEFDVYLVLLSGHKFAYPLPEGQIVQIIKGEFSNAVQNTLTLPSIARRYLSFLKENDISVSLSFLNRSNFINCIVRKNGWKGKVIISERAFSALAYKSGIKKIIGNYLIRSLYKYADGLIAISKGVEHGLKKNYSLNIWSETIYNPVDIDSILAEYDKHPVEQKGRPFTFICIARFNPQKNHRMLILAFSQLNSLDCKLLLMGEGPTLDTIQRLVIEKNLQSKVEFLGFRQDSVRFLKNADCLVLSSDFEGLGNVILESMTCSVPVISTDCFSGPREILAPGTDYTQQIRTGMEVAEFGILTPVANADLFAMAMKKMAEDKLLYNSYKEKMLDRAKMFDINVISEKFKDVIWNIHLTHENSDRAIVHT